MKIETVKIDALAPDPANVRKHDAINLEAIKGSLKRFGQQKPIVVDEKNIVIAGNGTLAAARALGWNEIDIVRTALIGPEATAFAIADNRAAELAEWDDNALAQTLAALQTQDGELAEMTGFSAEDVRKIIDETSGAESTRDVEIRGIYQITIACENESQQAELYERLTREGLTCRVSTL